MDITEEDKQKIREKIEKLKNSKFKQQTLSAWRPAPTAMTTTITFGIFSVIFLVIGIILQVMSDRIFEVQIIYDEKCYDKLQADNDKCIITNIELKTDVPGPVFIYYGLDNYYQNHRTYFLSRDSEQLQGTYKKFTELGTCNPVIRNQDLWPSQQKSISGLDLNLTDPAIPCGLIAKSIFNDTFELFNEDESSGEKFVLIDQTRIAWPSDIQFNFRNIYEGLPENKTFADVQWMSLTDERLMVWMRTAGLTSFRKIYGTIKDGLPAGTYRVEIKNEFNVQPFKGAKYFVMTTTNALGGNNMFLATSYIVFGTFCLLFAFVFFVATVRKQVINPIA